MFEVCKERMKNKTSVALNMDEFEKSMDENQGFIEAMWCGSEECEAKIKAEEEKKNPVGIPVSGLATIETDPTVIENKDFEDSENIELSDNNTENDTDDRLNPYTLEIASLLDI